MSKLPDYVHTTRFTKKRFPHMRERIKEVAHGKRMSINEFLIECILAAVEHEEVAQATKTEGQKRAEAQSIASRMPSECPKCGGHSIDMCGTCEIAGVVYKPPVYFSCNECLWTSMSIEEIKKHPHVWPAAAPLHRTA